MHRSCLINFRQIPIIFCLSLQYVGSFYYAFCQKKGKHKSKQLINGWTIMEVAWSEKWVDDPPVQKENCFEDEALSSRMISITCEVNEDKSTSSSDSVTLLAEFSVWKDVCEKSVPYKDSQNGFVLLIWYMYDFAKNIQVIKISCSAKLAPWIFWIKSSFENVSIRIFLNLICITTMVYCYFLCDKNSSHVTTNLVLLDVLAFRVTLLECLPHIHLGMLQFLTRSDMLPNSCPFYCLNMVGIFQSKGI